MNGVGNCVRCGNKMFGVGRIPMKWGICYRSGKGVEHIRRGVVPQIGVEIRSGSGKKRWEWCTWCGSGNHTHVSCPLHIFPLPLQIRLLNSAPLHFFCRLIGISHYVAKARRRLSP